MNFKVINDSFQCANCGAEVPPHPSSCRNHCTHCLHSLHVDAEFPGDRASNCHGLMAPFGLEQSGKKGWILLHECKKCGHIMKNKVADDDDWDTVVQLSKRPL